MKTYAILPLRFIAPVHFGDAAQGGGLEEVGLTCRADTLYSALTVEALRKSQSAFDEWIRKTHDGSIRISDLFPWYGRNTNFEFYIPKPVLEVKAGKKTGRETLTEARNLSAFRKQAKKRAFLRASEMGLYLDDLAYHTSSLEEEPTFGTFGADTHFNGRTGKPYGAGSFSFHDNAGLYLLVELSQAEDLDMVTSLMTWTGLSGIGGRRSSGMGKFELAHEPILLEAGEDWEDHDEVALYDMLQMADGDVQMAIAGFLPRAEEAAMAAEGRGLWVKRSGFTWTEGMDAPVKEKSIYMMAAGSTFSSRMEGRIADVSTPAVGHPVYRYGKGFFLGVPL